MINPLLNICVLFYTPKKSNVGILHQLSFNMPATRGEMNGLERLLCASTTCAMRKCYKN